MIEYIKTHKKTLFLKISLVFMFVPVVLIVIFASPSLYFEAVENKEVNVYFVLSFVILMDLVLIPSGVAIFQTMKLFNNIEKGSYYSNQTIHYLSTIKICGIVAGVLFGLMLPSIFYFVQMDDAPGLALVGLVFILASVSVAIFASVMKDLVKRKID